MNTHDEGSACDTIFTSTVLMMMQQQHMFTSEF